VKKVVLGSHNFDHVKVKLCQCSGMWMCEYNCTKMVQFYLDKMRMNDLCFSYENG